MTAALVLLALAAPADTVRASCPGGQALDRDDLAGVILMTDLLALIDGVAWSSADGFDRRPLVGDGPLGRRPWTVLLDGVPVEMGSFSEADVHLLPVEPGELERVIYCPGAQLAAGRFAGSGTLSLTTRRPVRPTVEGTARIANESGDPGPRRYLPDASPNVDKVGPDVAARLAYDVVAAGGRFERRYPSDPFAFERNSAALGHFPMVRYGAAGLRAGRPGSSVRFDAGATYAADLWLGEWAGRELPVRRLGTQGALTAGRVLGRLSAGARIAANWAAVDRRPEVSDSAFAGFDPDLRRGSVALDLSAGAARGRSAFSAGVHAEGERATGPGLDGASAGFVRTWLSRSGEPRPGWHHRYDSGLISDGDDVGIELSYSVTRSMEHGALSLTVSRDDDVASENRTHAYWAGRGYAGLLRPEVQYVPAAPPLSTEWAVRLDGSASPAPSVSVRASVVVRDFSGATVEDAAFRPDSMAHVAGAVAAVPGLSGQVITVSAGVSGATGRLTWGTSYRFTRAVAGDDILTSAWRVVPEHLARTHVTLRPDAGLSLRLAAEARSATRWDAFSAFEGLPVAGDRPYSARVPGAFLVDFDVRKAILDGRVHLAASARNLLNETDRTHPLGASLSFLLLVSASARL